MAIIDLDQAKLARAEARGDTRNEVVFGGRSFKLPPELPYDFAEFVSEGKYREGLAVLMDGDSQEFFETKPTLEDLEEFTTSLVKMYTGRAEGESSASSGSSRKTTRKRKPPTGESTTEA